MLITNLKISRKLALGFFLVVATIMAMSAAVYWNIANSRVTQQERALVNDVMAVIQNAKALAGRQENSYRGYLLSNDPYYLERLDAHRTNFNAQINRLTELAEGFPEMAQHINAATDGLAEWWKNVVEVGKRLASDSELRKSAVEMVGRSGIADTYMGKLEDALDALAEAADVRIHAARIAADEALDFNERVLTIGQILATIIAIALGYLLTRMIATPIHNLTSVMGRLASGDNSVEVPGLKRRDEIGEMARAVQVFKDAAIEKLRIEGEADRIRSMTDSERQRHEAEAARVAEEDRVAIEALGRGLAALASGDLTFRINVPFAPKAQSLKDDFNRTAEQLEEAMATIYHAIEGMRSGTSEISQAADDLSRRTEQQAASLEETAAALDQITATVRTTADGAMRASELTTQARQGAERSGVVVRDAVAAMAQIERSSAQISQIIGVIDEIAFQTNLLALNAGVEAARAGEAGRGFAVVASEVRALAQRSAEAAKEIKELISTSTQQVDQGVDLVGQTGSALEKIVAQVAQITTLVTEIAASAREQSTGLAEVNTAVNQMDQVTQQNAAMVEETTAASHNLAQEAEELARLVAKFQLSDRGQKPARISGAAPALSAPAKQAAIPQLKTVSSAGGARSAALLAQRDDDENWDEF